MNNLILLIGQNVALYDRVCIYVIEGRLIMIDKSKKRSNDLKSLK